MAAAHDRYLEALRQELAAWQALDGKLPGQPGHDPAAYRHWLRAAAETEAARPRTPDPRADS